MAGMFVCKLDPCAHMQLCHMTVIFFKSNLDKATHMFPTYLLVYPPPPGHLPLLYIPACWATTT